MFNGSAEDQNLFYATNIFVTNWIIIEFQINERKNFKLVCLCLKHKVFMHSYDSFGIECDPYYKGLRTPEAE